jgi:hypothetical protein
MILVALTVLAGTLRYAWIFTAHPYASADNFRERYVYSDMSQYWARANDVWHRDGEWVDAELLFPPGTEMLFAFALGPDMDRIAVFQTMQWLLAMGIFAGTGLLAYLLYGTRVGLTALAIAAACFPLFDYAAYALSETPFTFMLTAATLCAAMSFKKGPWWLLAAGACFGIATSFKSIGLIAGILLAASVATTWQWSWAKRAAGALLFLAGLCATIAPASLVMTARNDGEFLLLSNDALRIAMANHGDLMGVKATFPDGSNYEVGSPVSLEKKFTAIREIQVDITDIYGENRAWVMAHPLLAVRDFGIRIVDMAYGTHPLPHERHGVPTDRDRVAVAHAPVHPSSGHDLVAAASVPKHENVTNEHAAPPAPRDEPDRRRRDRRDRTPLPASVFTAPHPLRSHDVRTRHAGSRIRKTRIATHAAVWRSAEKMARPSSSTRWA